MVPWPSRVIRQSAINVACMINPVMLGARIFGSFRAGRVASMPALPLQDFGVVIHTLKQLEGIGTGVKLAADQQCGSDKG